MRLTRTIEWKFSAGDVVCFKTDETQNTRMIIHCLEANVCDADEMQKTYMVRVTCHEERVEWGENDKRERKSVMSRIGNDLLRVRESEIVAYVPKPTAESAA